MYQITMFMRQPTTTGSLQQGASKVRLGLSGGSETVLVAADSDTSKKQCSALESCGYRAARSERNQHVVILAADERRAIDLALAERPMPQPVPVVVGDRMRVARLRTPAAFLSGSIHDGAVPRNVVTGPRPALEPPFSVEQLSIVARGLAERKRN